MKVLKIIIPITILFSVIAIDYYNKFYKENTAFDEEAIFLYVMEGDSLAFADSISKYLKSTKTFYKVADRLNYLDNKKTGRFKIIKGIGNNDIVRSLKFNNTPVTVTFNNQERIENLAGRISKQIYEDSLSLINSFKDEDFLMSNDLNEENILSIFIPNSYKIYWNTSSDDFRDKMLSEFKKFWNQDRSEKAKNLGLSKLEIISLASIVQIESRKIDERPRVAGLYINRLQDKMRLQADPTVIYTIKDYYKNFDTIIRRVLYRDLKLDSEFNTYKIKGLPPGPITMPDISAIDAVLDYEKHDYLFMVANPSNRGYHLFASDLSGHNRNKKAYIRWINSKGIYR
ncbi:MAG: endolytic transglycosylase MltG [Flavobacteriaceae bacterium]|nr:endolytic transglycosylase MltG [Flavobacteriaceae bacterium]